jgi:urea transport system permease protein
MRDDVAGRVRSIAAAAAGIALVAVATQPGLAAPVAAGYDRAAIVGKLCGEGGGQALEAVGDMLAGLPSSSPADRAWLEAVVPAFAGKKLLCAAGGAAYLPGDLNATTLAAAAPPDDARAPLPSLRVRGLLEEVAAAETLFSSGSDAAKLAAAKAIEVHGDAISDQLIVSALDRQAPGPVRDALQNLLQTRGLRSPDPAKRLAAIRALAADPTSRVVTQLAALRADAAYASDPKVRDALDGSLASARLTVWIGDGLSLLYNSVSAGSVLFLSSVGLAIIFGLMGVINLAQGEFMMIGAYTTFCVQEALRAWLPGLFDWYPIVAIPIVFLVVGAVGVAIETLAIRRLYKHPLITLLATWAIGLLLVNLVRVAFGTQNLKIATPPFLAGGFRVMGDFIVTWNHLDAIAFAVVAFALTQTLLRFTDFGLFIRAVTQNRAMAGCVGVSTRRVDQLAFGLGAGLAGLAGLALSPIYNVNPTMGGGFIIDSFMVVVLGGVGSLVGTAVASVGIALVNVGIEPFYGAVAAKVIALLVIIVLIQWRPEGLIGASGRR